MEPLFAQVNAWDTIFEKQTLSESFSIRSLGKCLPINTFHPYKRIGIEYFCSFEWNNSEPTPWAFELDGVSAAHSNSSHCERFNQKLIQLMALLVVYQRNVEA